MLQGRTGMCLKKHMDLQTARGVCLEGLTSNMQQPRLKMSAFSLYGCLSTTSGAMLRKDPV